MNDLRFHDHAASLLPAEISRLRVACHAGRAQYPAAIDAVAYSNSSATSSSHGLSGGNAVADVELAVLLAVLRHEDLRDHL